MKMKRNLQTAIIALSCLFFSACEQDLPSYLNYNYAYSGLDTDGGNWKPVLIGSGAEIQIEAPTDVNSAAYKEEVNAAKSAIKNMTDAQKQHVAYWTNNPANRWNEIALELIAKYNLIPGPNPDGTYTLPNASTPDGPPAFPFAHPPYAVRALAYLSVAQFDGLISAWHYKYLYNRAAPYKVDNEIKFAYNVNDLPAYPSDAAVIANASKEILSVMFPLEKNYLEKRAQEHLESILLAGGNVTSDIEAGKKIGSYVAAKALAKASTDGMRSAQTPKPVSDSIKTRAFQRFGWAWDNIEIPVRPVGLTPMFGNVKMWNVPNVEATRPIPPPAIGSEELKKDIEILKDYAANVTNERRRIANYWQDGLGTYTPPGHWNRFAKEFIIQYALNPLRTVRTYAYLNMSMMDGAISCWDTKYYYHYPRPINLIPGFKTIAGTPNFPAYTSGHSVFSSSGAEILAYVFPNEATKVRDWAKEAAISRVYGGIHWTFDAQVGTKQGIDVANYTLAVARNDGAQ